jgi:hypothetical protein
MRVLSMDEEGFGSDALRSEASNWYFPSFYILWNDEWRIITDGNREVYRDAFAPPAPSRRVKPWERAPVPAHAPRLQGQKVWKKVGLKARSKEGAEENIDHEGAQEELERGGMGARKRARVTGGNKENISDAPWKTGLVDKENGGNGGRLVSPKKQRMSMGSGDMDALVVPRKRTNANHLITPRKAGWKIPFIESTHATAVAPSLPESLIQSPAKLSPQKMLLNAHEKDQDDITSLAKASPQRIPLNDLDQGEDGVTVPAEKPVRRRKSLRRSTRRLTRGTTPEQPPAAPAEELANNNASESAQPVLETPKKDLEARGDVAVLNESHGPASVEVPRESSVPIRVQEPASLEVVEASNSKSQPEADFSVEGPPIAAVAVAGGLDEEPLTQQQEVISEHTSGISQEESPKDTIESATVVEDPFTAAANETPKSQPILLNSIEVGTETQFTSPTKGSGTPRQRRKTPQRQGSRRSARSTRANSVPPEEQPALGATEIQNSNPASSPIKSRMAKSPTKKSRRSTAQPTPREIISAEAAMSEEIEAVTPTSKFSVETQIHAQQVEPTETEGITIIRQSSSISHSEDVNVLGPTIENSSSGADSGGEGPNLAIAGTVKEETPVAGDLDIQEDTVELEVIATVVPTEDEHISSRVKPSRPEDSAQAVEPASDKAREGSVESLEVLEPISISTEKLLEDSIEEPTDELPGSSTPNPSTTELIETISENTAAHAFDHDDTDMLRNFLTRVKANKAAKAGTSIPKRKRSLPHSPIRLPLESMDAALSPSSPKSKDEFDVNLPADLAAKRKQEDANLDDDEGREPRSIRRSGRTRLPVKAAPLAAPSFIPVRRLGQDGDNTVTLRRNEEKELAALTRVNTRKNKAGAQLPIQVLAKQAEEREDPASRQRALKEAFDDKAQKQKSRKKGKTVLWAEELAQFQNEEGKLVELEREPIKEKEKAAPVEEKKNAVKLGVRSKMALGMAVNGTPAPKRKMRGRA